jgi:hypothetical protein
MPGTIPRAVPSALHLRTSRDAFAVDGEVRKFGQRKQSQRHGDQRHAVEEIEPVECPAQCSGLRARSDHGDHQPDAGGGQALQRHASRKRRHHGKAENAESQKLRRADREHHGLKQRDRQRQYQRAENTAHRRGDEAGAEGTAGLPLARHLVTVDDGGRGADRAGHAEQHRGNQIRRRCHRRDAEEQREGGRRIQIVGKGNQHRERNHAAEARHAADRKTDQHAEHENHQPGGLQQQLQRMERHIQLARHRPAIPSQCKL